MSEMTPERIAEIRDRVGRTSDGPWVPSGFSGIIDGPAYVGVINLTGFRRFYDADFVAHARQDVPDLLDALTAERQRAERAEAWAGRWKRAAKAMRGNWNDAMGYWHSAVRAWAEKFKQESARAERAEQREQRLREALLTGGDCKPGECHPLCEEEGGHAIYVCMACANVVDTVDDARHVPGCIVLESARAALAGPPETVSDSLVSDTATTTLSDSEATVADTACTEARHVVPAGADACVCGENRMERLL